MKDHLEYLKWYASVILDPNVPLEVLLKPPQVCLNPRRSAYERNLYVRYGLLFQARERYREPPPLAITGKVEVPDIYTEMLGAPIEVVESLRPAKMAREESKETKAPP